MPTTEATSCRLTGSTWRWAPGPAINEAAWLDWGAIETTDGVAEENRLNGIDMRRKLEGQ
jgi:hypothetical protein